MNEKQADGADGIVQARPVDHSGDHGRHGNDYGPRRVQGAAVVPGVAAGVTGLGVFLILHTVWIVPIWSVAPLGLVIAVVGGAAVSWAYLHVEPHLPPGYLRRWAAVAGGAVLSLTPAVLLAWIGDPYFTVVDGVGVPTAELSTIVVRFVVEFLLVTILSGALLGWAVTRTRRGTVAVGVAALAFALGPGHNLPFFHVGTMPTETRTGLVLTVVPILIASAVFVAADEIQSRGVTPR